jgi:hypothetical protein
MNDEIKALREEVARLRERVAVLEIRQQAAPYTGPITPWPQFPFSPPTVPPQYPLWVITCDEVRYAPTFGEPS